MLGCGSLALPFQPFGSRFRWAAVQGAPLALAPPLVRAIFENEGRVGRLALGLGSAPRGDGQRQEREGAAPASHGPRGRHRLCLRASDYLRRPCRPGVPITSALGAAADDAWILLGGMDRR